MLWWTLLSQRTHLFIQEEDLGEASCLCLQPGFTKQGGILSREGGDRKSLFLVEAGPGDTWQVAQSSLILKTPEISLSPNLSTSWKDSVEVKAKSRARTWLLSLLEPQRKVWSRVFIFFFLISWMR